MKKDKLLPRIRKSIGAYIKQEEGTINKHALFSLGSFLTAGILSSKLIEASQVVVTHNHSDIGHSNCSHTSDTGTAHTNCTHTSNTGTASTHTNCTHTHTHTHTESTVRATVRSRELIANSR